MVTKVGVVASLSSKRERREGESQQSTVSAPSVMMAPTYPLATSGFTAKSCTVGLWAGHASVPPMTIMSTMVPLRSLGFA